MNSKWIGPDELLRLDDVGFLVEFSNPSKGSENWVLRALPACGNRSGEPMLYGWCGSFNDLSTNAHGMARVVRVARNGRVLVAPITGAELAGALEELGYPEMNPS